VFQVVVHKSFLRRQEWLLLKAIVEYLGTASEFTGKLVDVQFGRPSDFLF
jgi:hypothetical protein